MSPQDSTTGGKDLRPYWSDFIAEINSHLWLPTGTASPASAPSSSSKCSSLANSWFSTSEISAPQRNSPRIYSPSLLSSLPEPTDSAGTGRKSRRIRIYPDRQQKAKPLVRRRPVHLQPHHRTPQLRGSPKSLLARGQEGHPIQSPRMDQARSL